MKLLVFGLCLNSYVQGSAFAQDQKEHENWFNYRMIKTNHLRRNGMEV